MKENFPDNLTSHGVPIPPDIMGDLFDSSSAVDDGPTLRNRLETDGYIFFRDVLNKKEIMAAREEVFEKLEAVGEVKNPAIEGLATGVSQREEKVESLGEFWKEICESPTLRKVTHQGRVLEIMECVHGAPVVAFDFLWLRTGAPGKASPFHFDHVYMNRGTDQLITTWIPLGDAPLSDGPILLMEGSHKFDDLVDKFRGLDVDAEPKKPGFVTMEPMTIAKERGCRLLSTDFRAGDLLLMDMFLMHGSLDNNSPVNRIRLSSDTRIQPASEPMDERYVGPNPTAHGGGYANISGCQPITSEHIRR